MFAFTQTKKCGKIVAVKESGGPGSAHIAENGRVIMEVIDMDRWETRYVRSRSGSVQNVDRSRVERVKNIVIILLTVALLGVGIAGIQAISLRDKAEDLFIVRAIAECNDAVGTVNTMSRSGGSDTAGELGKIRANIKAVDTLNSMSQSLYGRAYVPQTTFSALYAVIDSYSGKLKNGTSAIEDLTKLADGLTSLQAVLQEAR